MNGLNQRFLSLLPVLPPACSQEAEPSGAGGRQDPELGRPALRCLWAAEGFARTFFKPLNLTELMPCGWG